MTETLIIAACLGILFILAYFVGRGDVRKSSADEVEDVEYDEEDTEPLDDAQDVFDFRKDGIDEDGRNAQQVEEDLKQKLEGYD